MRKLALSWIAVGALVTLLLPGCVSTGRHFPLAARAKVKPKYVSEHRASDRADSQVRGQQGIFNSVDPESQVGSGGVYVAGGSTTRGWPATVGSMGIFQLPTSWSTVRYGVFGLDNNGIGVGGVEGGIRLHAPTRFTPYVGLSGDFGFSSLHSGISHNRSGSTRYPPYGAHITTATGLLAIVPEAGVSYWLNSSTRLNAGASYYVADGRPDFLVFGLSLEFLSWDGSDFSGNSSSGTGRRPQRLTDSHGISSESIDRMEPYFLRKDDSIDGAESDEPRRDIWAGDASSTFTTLEEIDRELSSQVPEVHGAVIPSHPRAAAFEEQGVEIGAWKRGHDDPLVPLVSASSLLNHESL